MLYRTDKVSHRFFGNQHNVWEIEYLILVVAYFEIVAKQLFGFIADLMSLLVQRKRATSVKEAALFVFCRSKDQALHGFLDTMLRKSLYRVVGPPPTAV